jgi:parvulin-like peptidyl-prolyl isomerase
MTSRLRPVTRRRRSFRPSLQGEERQQFVVTAVFVGLIVLLIALLIGAIGLAWYNDNLRPVAKVGPVEILPATVRDRAELLQARLTRREGQLRAAHTRGEITLEEMTEQIDAVNQLQGQIGTASVEGLIDDIYKSQLATDRGVTVSEADIDQRMLEEVSSPERRHVLAVFVEPMAAEEDGSPTLAERRNALQRAQTALEQIRSGRPFADVAAEFSTHPSRDSGGDYGTITEAAAGDAAWSEALFDLEQGATTDIIRGADGIYRIGQVVEIVPGQEEPGRREDLLRLIPAERLREFLGYEIAAERLEDQIVAEAVSATPEQVRLANIFIEGLFTGDEVAEGEVAYSEIVQAPADDLASAPNLDADDPKWEEARIAAEAAATELRAITDPEQLAERFAALAGEVSDSPSADEGGEVEFTTRGLLPTAVGDALFDAEHQQNELIGPIRAEAGYWLILFDELREAPEKRVQDAIDAASQPDADFAAIAREHSDGPDAEDGGDIGWVTAERLNAVDAELDEQVFALQPGQISEPIDIGGEVPGHYIFKVYERGTRPLDPDQLSDIRANAFERWYAPQKDEAEETGVISRTDEEPDELDPGIDQPLDPGADEPLE